MTNQTEPPRSAAVIGWTATTIFALLMVASGALYLAGPPPIAEGFRHLGYPPYFRVLLGAAKLLGVAAILGARRGAVVREWAYAGFTFDFVSAFVAHLASDRGKGAALPLVALALLVASYLWWHRPRRRPAEKDGAREGGFGRRVALEASR